MKKFVLTVLWPAALFLLPNYVFSQTQIKLAGIVADSSRKPLALTWNFGKLSENVSKKKGVTNDDMLTKPAGHAGN